MTACLSVTRLYCIKSKLKSQTFLMGSPGLQFLTDKIHAEIRNGSPQVEVFNERRYTEVAIFGQVLYALLTGTRISRRGPWVILNVCCASFRAYHANFKNRPMSSAGKCCSGTPVFGNMRFVGIFAGIL